MGGSPLAGPVGRIALTGFMGAGKTTIGRELAAALGWSFVDLDQEITARTGRTVPAIFGAEGESRFRELEAQAFCALLSRELLVIALGGGSLESPALLQALEADTRTMLIFLDASLPELLARCGKEGGSAGRPLLKNPVEAELRFQRRLPQYRRAHLTVETEGSTSAEAVRRIRQHLAGLLP